MCIKGEAYTDGREKVSPAQCAWANHNACTVMNVKKNGTEKEK